MNNRHKIKIFIIQLYGVLYDVNIKTTKCIFIIIHKIGIVSETVYIHYIFVIASLYFKMLLI